MTGRRNEPHGHDPLETLLDGALRDLPLRRAPPTLESRVLAELARRESAPWLQRSFSHWPVTVRAAFVATCCALAGLIVVGAAWMNTLFRSFSPGSHSWWRRADAVAEAAGGLSVSLSDALPRMGTAPATWLEVTLAAAAFLYVCLFGLGAAAYRLLYLHPQHR